MRYVVLRSVGFTLGVCFIFGQRGVILHMDLDLIDDFADHSHPNDPLSIFVGTPSTFLDRFW